MKNCVINIFVRPERTNFEVKEPKKKIASIVMYSLFSITTSNFGAEAERSYLFAI